MTAMNARDVVISGAGLAGSALAILLARAGADVALVDAGRFPRPKLCGEYLSAEGAAALDRLGLAGDLERLRPHAIDRSRLTLPSGRSIEAPARGPDGRPALGLSRSALDALLVQTATDAGATLIDQARVGAPIVDDARGVVGVTARRADGSTLEVRARVVIAADGRHSSLVKQTGDTRTRERFRPRLFGLKRHFVVADPEAGDPEGTVTLHLLPGGYVGSCRVEGGLTNLCGLLPESAVKEARGDLDRLADAWFPRNPALDRLRRAGEPADAWKTVAGVQVEASRPRMPGILYAGDCRGTVDPLGGQGMTMALLGSELLAPLVLDALTVGAADAALQRRHEAAWHRRFDRRIRLCGLFHQTLTRPWLLEGLARLPRLAAMVTAEGFDRTRDPGPLAVVPT
jgi:flavin-dependent dehydrogenase